ncbi:hypothetical protein [Bradyrhizobium sp. CCGE-LA001]|uniref:hypothetical protein n=1 Tax=Bradyrhizobium sp. CCGE-LA001 TaxID=1223566 RepID=UPI0011981D82|nr:hypothetical protein [Bradyrhizobium sp. CCGE-LA001]
MNFVHLLPIPMFVAWLGTLAPAAAQVPNWNDDQAVCTGLGAARGLFLLYPAHIAAAPGEAGSLGDGRRYYRVNGVALTYHPEARLFMIGGRVLAGREEVWSVRTETIEEPGVDIGSRIEADKVKLWRPGIATECSGGKALLQFGGGRWLNSRWVSMREYAQNHADDISRNPLGTNIGDRLHLDLKDGGTDCVGSNSDLVTRGQRWKTYGFERLPDDMEVLRTVFGADAERRRQKKDAETRGSYTTEFAIVSAGDSAAPACFGFSVPTQDSWSFRTWQPYRTMIRLWRASKNGDRTPLVRTVTWKTSSGR